MKIIRLTSENASEILVIWEACIRVTHLFLEEEDILLFKSFVKMVCDKSFTSFFGIRDKNGCLIAFMGILGNNIDMLFVHPSFHSIGIGSSLLKFAVDQNNCNKVDVNEQNTKALEFYINKGFKVVSRSEKDDFGKRYPILHLELTK